MFVTVLLQVTVHAIPAIKSKKTNSNIENKIEDVFKDFPIDCKCVPFYLCKNETINVYGENILDIRYVLSLYLHFFVYHNGIIE